MFSYLCFTVKIDYLNCLKIFANSLLSASNLKSFSLSLEHFFLTVSQNNFGNKIPFFQKTEKQEKSKLFLWKKKLKDNNLNLCSVFFFGDENTFKFSRFSIEKMIR